MRILRTILAKNKRYVLVLPIIVLGLAFVAALVYHMVQPPLGHAGIANVRGYETAQAYPSESAKMICEDETQAHVTAIIGVRAAAVSGPMWDAASHVYSCNFMYAGSAHISLSVKELSSAAQTTAYFNATGIQRGRAKDLNLGQGAYAATDDSVVVRKDYKVLVVDVSRLPQQFPAAGSGK